MAGRGPGAGRGRPGFDADQDAALPPETSRVVQEQPGLFHRFQIKQEDAGLLRTIIFVVQPHQVLNPQLGRVAEVEYGAERQPPPLCALHHVVDRGPRAADEIHRAARQCGDDAGKLALVGPGEKTRAVGADQGHPGSIGDSPHLRLRLLARRILFAETRGEDNHRPGTALGQFGHRRHHHGGGDGDDGQVWGFGQGGDRRTDSHSQYLGGLRIHRPQYPVIAVF